jgi:hypothetical protein
MAKHVFAHKRVPHRRLCLARAPLSTSVLALPNCGEPSQRRRPPAPRRRPTIGGSRRRGRGVTPAPRTRDAPLPPKQRLARPRGNPHTHARRPQPRAAAPSRPLPTRDTPPLGAQRALGRAPLPPGRTPPLFQWRRCAGGRTRPPRRLARAALPLCARRPFPSRLPTGRLCATTCSKFTIRGKWGGRDQITPGSHGGAAAAERWWEGAGSRGGSHTRGTRRFARARAAARPGWGRGRTKKRGRETETGDRSGQAESLGWRRGELSFRTWLA